ncbi:kielin/chordin-like protein [Tribolium madens]|uniref:kielin/chordin-like protein n=1 Tax=Tribolium madens TaxID=41895 RepID=UPI001CF726A5|nr:kielin/chordin-like protein [Tribolium madens]
MGRLLLTAWLAMSYCLPGLTTASHPRENELDSHETHPINPKSPASVLHDEVDILKLMNVSAKDQGVSLVEGPITNFPAYKFRLPYGNVPLPNSTVVTTAMNSPEGFTVVFLYRQQKNNLGTLISVNSPGRLTPWFQLNSNSKMALLMLKYRIEGSPKLRQMDWELPKHHRKSPLAAWTWLSVSVDFTTGIVRLDLDCQPSRFESLTPGNDQSHISIPQDALVYFRQEPGRKKKFLGSMQVAKVLPYVQQQRLWTCVEISSNLAPELRKPLL